MSQQTIVALLTLFAVGYVCVTSSLAASVTLQQELMLALIAAGSCVPPKVLRQIGRNLTRDKKLGKRASRSRPDPFPATAQYRNRVVQALENNTSPLENGTNAFEDLVKVTDLEKSTNAFKKETNSIKDLGKVSLIEIKKVSPVQDLENDANAIKDLEKSSLKKDTVEDSEAPPEKVPSLLEKQSSDVEDLLEDDADEKADHVTETTIHAGPFWGTKKETPVETLPGAGLDSLENWQLSPEQLAERKKAGAGLDSLENWKLSPQQLAIRNELWAGNSCCPTGRKCCAQKTGGDIFNCVLANKCKQKEYAKREPGEGRCCFSDQI